MSNTSSLPTTRYQAQRTTSPGSASDRVKTSPRPSFRTFHLRVLPGRHKNSNGPPSPSSSSEPGIQSITPSVQDGTRTTTFSLPRPGVTNGLHPYSPPHSRPWRPPSTRGHRTRVGHQAQVVPPQDPPFQPLIHPKHVSAIPKSRSDLERPHRPRTMKSISWMEPIPGVSSGITNRHMTLA